MYRIPRLHRPKYPMNMTYVTYNPHIEKVVKETRGVQIVWCSIDRVYIFPWPCTHRASTMHPPSSSTVHPQYIHSAHTVHPPSTTFTRATTRGDAQTGHRPEAPSCLLPGQVAVQRILFMLIFFIEISNMATYQLLC